MEEQGAGHGYGNKKVMTGGVELVGRQIIIVITIHSNCDQRHMQYTYIISLNCKLDLNFIFKCFKYRLCSPVQYF